MLQRLLKVNVVYAAGSVANGAALFLLIPFLVKFLGPADFGLWSISEITIYFLTLVMMAGMDIYLMREYFFLKSESERKVLVGSMLGMAIVWGTGVIALFMLAVLLFSINGRLFDQFNPAILALIGAIGFCEVIFTLLLSIFRIQEKAFHFIFLSMGRMAMFMGAAIFWAKAGAGLSGALAGRLTATVVFIVIAWGMDRKYVQIGFSSKHLRPWANYGVPILFSGLLFYILISADRYALQIMAGLQVVAIYSLSYKFAASVDILVTRPFALDWAARRFSIATGNHPEQEYAKAAILYAFIALWCALLVQAGTPLLYDLFASSLYIQGLNALPVLLAANVILGLSYPLNVGIMLKDRTKLLLPITAMAGISYILALYFLIPHNPIQGAAWATLMAYSVHTSGITLVSLRLYPVKYPFQDWLLLGACSILAAAGLYLLNIDASPWAEALARGLWISLIFTLTGYFFWKCRSVLASAESTPSSK